MNKADKAAVLADLEVKLERVRHQSFGDDIATIEGLYGTRYIRPNASADDVKREALSQVKNHALDCINGIA
ncbi:hypothetical protein [Tardiphaga sp. 813_E8_N1_3]|uniref:hypothetical protein n=1 Tax=Tardiphaga sp. 813_E8_N1_3 TaxID=3240760 RepID=UPI003F26F505